MVSYRVYFVSSHPSKYVGNSPVTYYLYGPDLAWYPITGFFRPWPLEVEVRCCAWHVVLFMIKFVPSYFKISWLMKKLYTKQKYHRTDHVKLWHSNVTLTLKVGIWLLHKTHGPIIVNILCQVISKSLEQYKKNLKCTQNIPYKRPC
jgi:hypothetical protein